ncbi:MAG TPA: Lsr2 family protein [Pseudonocardiaceae bacterium]|nr:Lsr2 family protein [Pseudonocardiaceae bacterium]
MAQEVTVRLTDDVDGSAADETLAFSLDGVHWTIDLCADNAAKLRADIGRWTAHARKERPGKGGNTPRRRRSDSESQTIRAWAQEQGIALAPRGRIPADVVDRYRRRTTVTAA